MDVVLYGPEKALAVSAVSVGTVGVVLIVLAIGIGIFKLIRRYRDRKHQRSVDHS